MYLYELHVNFRERFETCFDRPKMGTIPLGREIDGSQASTCRKRKFLLLRAAQALRPADIIEFRERVYW